MLGHRNNPTCFTLLLQLHLFLFSFSVHYGWNYFSVILPADSSHIKLHYYIKNAKFKVVFFFLLNFNIFEIYLNERVGKCHKDILQVNNFARHSRASIALRKAVGLV